MKELIYPERLEETNYTTPFPFEEIEVMNTYVEDGVIFIRDYTQKLTNDNICIHLKENYTRKKVKTLIKDPIKKVIFYKDKDSKLLFTEVTLRDRIWILLTKKGEEVINLFIPSTYERRISNIVNIVVYQAIEYLVCEKAMRAIVEPALKNTITGTMQIDTIEHLMRTLDAFHKFRPYRLFIKDMITYFKNNNRQLLCVK